jgi:hypothetical protein
MGLWSGAYKEVEFMIAVIKYTRRRNELDGES